MSDTRKRQRLVDRVGERAAAHANGAVRSAAPLTIESDRDALGPRTYPQRPFPREFVRLALPPLFPSSAYIVLPAEMTADEWDALTNALAAMRPGLVR